MNKAPFDNIALILTDRLFKYEKKAITYIKNSAVDNKYDSSINSVEISERDLASSRALEVKKAKVYYSINLLLNESSKLLVLAVLAILLHVFVKYVFCLFILMLTRSILGGLHGKSYLQCLLITMLCIGLAIYASPIIVVNYWIAGFILGVWCILVVAVGPIQSKNRLKIKESKRKKNKIYLLVMSIALFGVTMLLGQAYNQMYVFLLLFQMVGVIIK